MFFKDKICAGKCPFQSLYEYETVRVPNELVIALQQSFIKVVRVDWLGNLARYKEDYNVSLFYIMCTVTVRIFCSRCDASLVRLPVLAACSLTS